MRNVTPPVLTTQIKSEEGESHDEIGENLPKVNVGNPGQTRSPGQFTDRLPRT